MPHSFNRVVQHLLLFSLTLVAISSSFCLTCMASAQNAPPGQRIPRPLPKAEVGALLDKAYDALNTGKLDAAAQSFNEALIKAQSLTDLIGEGTALRGLGNVAASHSQHKTALDFYDRALALFVSTGDKQDEAVTLNNFGMTYYQLSQPAKAMEYFQKALDLFRATGETNGEAQALVNLGNVYWIIGQPEKARENYLLALPLHRSEGDKNGEARALMNIGFLYLKSGQPKSALEYFLKALPIFQTERDARSEAAVLVRIGLVYTNTGQSELALDFFQKALPLQNSIGDKQGRASALTNIGNVYLSFGQPLKAKGAFLESLSIAKDISDSYGEATALTNLGIACFELGDPWKSLEYYQKALPILKESGNRNYEAGTLYNIGAAYAHTGQAQKALDYFRRALALSTDLQDREGMACSLTGIGNMERGLGRMADAETHLREAVLLTEDFRSRLGGYSTAKSSFLARKIGRYYDYLRILIQNRKASEAFSIAQKTKARNLLDLLSDGKVDLSSSLTPEERKEEQELTQMASDLNEQMAKEASRNTPDSKQRFSDAAEKLKKVEGDLQTLTDTLYARHPGVAHKRAATTTTLADLARFLPTDTALLDYVVVSRQEVCLFVVTAKRGKSTLHTHSIRVDYDTLERMVSTFHAACSDPGKPYQTEASALFDLLLAPAEDDIAGRKRLLVCPDQALWNIPFAALMPRSPVAALIPPSPVLPSHPAGNASSRPFLADRFEIDYAYSATGAQAALQEQKPTPPSGSILAVANPDFGDTTRFGGIDSLPGQRHFSYPPRPFDTPSRPIDYPAIHFDISSVPLNSKSKRIRTPYRPIDRPARPIYMLSRPIDKPSRAMTDALSRGNTITALPGTKREADAILTLFPDAHLLEGDDAQEEAVKQLAGSFRYLHFATHGFLNDASPLLSSVVLAKPGAGSKEDGFLTAREVFDLKLNAEMVVLSACNSGRGEVRTGEGIVGLTWAFFAAGVPTQIVSQWSVDDAATAQLMTSFYRNLKAGKSKGAALREASLSLRGGGNRKSKIENRQYAHPYYWAPFTLVGDWR